MHRKIRQIYVTTLTYSRKGRFHEKSSYSFGFCRNYLDPPPSPPQFGQLVPLFLNANVPKNLGRGLALPPHPQIDPIYGSVSAGREKWPFNVLFFFEVEPPCEQT